MNDNLQFSGAQRLLHWTMAVIIVAMLFVGVGMVTTVSTRHTWLVDLHKPLGVAVLVLALVRLAVRMRRGAPPLPDDMPSLQKGVAHLSHIALYGLMIAMPLLGWAMVSAGGYPVTLFGGVHLPPIAPADAWWFARLHLAHTVLAYVLFATVLGHLGAALFHGLIRRDGVLESMTTGAR